MSDSLQASPEHIADTASFVGSKAAEVDTGVRDFAKMVEELMESGWRGGAADTFTAAFEEWRDSARQITAALESSSRLLQQAGVNYVHTDTGNAADMRARTSSID